jgi:hypothetical protein
MLSSTQNSPTCPALSCSKPLALGQRRHRPGVTEDDPYTHYASGFFLAPAPSFSFPPRLSHSPFLWLSFLSIPFLSLPEFSLCGTNGSGQLKEEKSFFLTSNTALILVVLSWCRAIIVLQGLL